MGGELRRKGNEEDEIEENENKVIEERERIGG